MTAISNLFTITSLTDYKWEVTWRGAVRHVPSKEIIANFARNSGSYEIGFVTSQGNCYTISGLVWDTMSFQSAVLIEQLFDIAAVYLDKKEHAENFVENMEKHIMWLKLSKKT